LHIDVLQLVDFCGIFCDLFCEHAQPASERYLACFIEEFHIVINYVISYANIESIAENTNKACGFSPIFIFL